MWFAGWLAFVLVCVGGPLLYARWRERTLARRVARLPDPRARQRPAPDEAEEVDLLTARLRVVAAAAAVVATVWLVVVVWR